MFPIKMGAFFYPLVTKSDDDPKTLRIIFVGIEMKYLVLPFFLLCLLTSSIASAQAVGAACTAAQEGYVACVASGCYKCTSLVWTQQPLTIGNTAAACDSSHAGMIRWTGTAMEYCNGTAWTAMGGGGSVPAGTLCGLSRQVYTYDNDNGGTWGGITYVATCNGVSLTGSNCPSGYTSKTTNVYQGGVTGYQYTYFYLCASN